MSFFFFFFRFLFLYERGVIHLSMVLVVVLSCVTHDFRVRHVLVCVYEKPVAGGNDSGNNGGNLGGNSSGINVGDGSGNNGGNRGCNSSGYQCQGW